MSAPAATRRPGPRPARRRTCRGLPRRCATSSSGTPDQSATLSRPKLSGLLLPAHSMRWEPIGRDAARSSSMDTRAGPRPPSSAMLQVPVRAGDLRRRRGTNEDLGGGGDQAIRPDLGEVGEDAGVETRAPDGLAKRRRSGPVAGERHEAEQLALGHRSPHAAACATTRPMRRAIERPRRRPPPLSPARNLRRRILGIMWGASRQRQTAERQKADGRTAHPCTLHPCSLQPCTPIIP